MELNHWAILYAIGVIMTYTYLTTGFVGSTLMEVAATELKKEEPAIKDESLMMIVKVMIFIACLLLWMPILIMFLSKK